MPHLPTLPTYIPYASRWVVLNFKIARKMGNIWNKRITLLSYKRKALVIHVFASLCFRFFWLLWYPYACVLKYKHFVIWAAFQLNNLLLCVPVLLKCHDGNPFEWNFSQYECFKGFLSWFFTSTWTQVLWYHKLSAKAGPLTLLTLSSLRILVEAYFSDKLNVSRILLFFSWILGKGLRYAIQNH